MNDALRKTYQRPFSNSVSISRVRLSVGRGRNAPMHALIALITALLMAMGCGDALQSPQPHDDGSGNRSETRTGRFLLDDVEVELDYELHDGLIVVEDDIVLDPQSQIPDHGTAAPSALLAVKSDGRLWPDGIVPYKIHSSVTTPGRVRKAMREWEEKTNVRFVPRDGEDAFLVFRENAGNTVCRAQVGYNGGRRVVFLRDTSIRSACNLGVVVHEIGHVLGLWHEHTRDDRDNYVNIIWDYVGSRAAFAKKTSGVRKVGPYDIKSTMHYRSYTYSSPSNKASIRKKDGSLLLHNWADLSPDDIVRVNSLYPAAEEEPPEDEPVLEALVEQYEGGLPWESDLRAPADGEPDAVEEPGPIEDRPGAAPSPDGEDTDAAPAELPASIDATGGCSTVATTPPPVLLLVAVVLGTFGLCRRRLMPRALLRR